MQDIKISVVTVCLNTVDTIKKTIESVLGQTYGNLEYVIVDGKSTDGTFEIIREYEGIKTVSDKDNGLYNAMNKGIDLCTGDYILFLNSGDVFADRNVVNDVVARIGGETGEDRSHLNGKIPDGKFLPDIVYCNVTKIYKDQNITERYPGKHTVFQLLMMGKMPCHQGIFAKASILKRFRFDESYKICADFDFLLRCVRERVRMQYVDVNVSIVDCVMGISSQEANLDRMRTEDDRSIKKNYPALYWLMWIPKKIVRISR